MLFFDGWLAIGLLQLGGLPRCSGGSSRAFTQVRGQMHSRCLHASQWQLRRELLSKWEKIQLEEDLLKAVAEPDWARAQVLIACGAHVNAKMRSVETSKGTTLVRFALTQGLHSNQ